MPSNIHWQALGQKFEELQKELGRCKNTIQSLQLERNHLGDPSLNPNRTQGHNPPKLPPPIPKLLPDTELLPLPSTPFRGTKRANAQQDVDNEDPGDELTYSDSPAPQISAKQSDHMKKAKLSHHKPHMRGEYTPGVVLPHLNRHPATATPNQQPAPAAKQPDHIPGGPEMLKVPISSDTEPITVNNIQQQLAHQLSPVFQASRSLLANQTSSKFQHVARLVKDYPLFRNATFYTPKFQDEPSISSDLEPFLSNVMLHGERMNSAAHNALYMQFSLEAQSMHAPPGTSDTYVPWHCPILLFFLRDRLCWISDSLKDGCPNLQIQQNVRDPQPGVDTTTLPMYESYLNWPTVVKAFCNATVQSSPSHSIPSSSTVTGLLHPIRKTAKTSQLQLSKEKFCLAAMALRAMSQVRPFMLENHEKKRNKAEKNPLVAYLRSEVSADSAHAMLNWTDQGLLRVLYYAVAFSVFCLLDGTKISPNQGKHVSITKLTEALRYPSLPLDKLRLRIELDVWTLLIRMAIDGAEEYDKQIFGLAKSWSELGFGSGSDGKALPEAGVALSVEAWNAKL